MAEEFTLYYHAGSRGFAEKVRIMFQETGLKYKDVPVDASTFDKMKKDGTISYGQLPIVKHGDNVIEESVNILEYIADIADQRKLGSGGNKYLGADNSERYKHRASALAVCHICTYLSLFIRLD